MRLDVLDDSGLQSDAGGPTTRPTLQDVLKVDPRLSAAL